VNIDGSDSRRLIGLAPLLLAALLIAPAATSQEEPPAWAYQLSHDLMSPFCPGRTLAECPSPQADELRLWILTQAAAGATREEVESQVIARFGEVVRSAPKAEGWGLTAYAIPIVGFLAGGFLVVYVLRRLSSPGRGSDAPRPATVPASQGDSELERLVDAELGRG
jgi:cytochrome c-type biogenesis protein CcmH/NrfF